MKSETYNQQLLVEGNDDLHVLSALCEKLRISQSFNIIDCKGISNIFEQIPTRFKQSEIETIGIIIDADTNLLSRWDSLKDILNKQGYNLPKELPSDGIIAQNSDNITVGVWIMPNNNLNGMLEDFIAFLVPKDDKLLPIVRTNLENIEKEALNKYLLIHKSKAAIYSWLALQEDPGTPMGLSITKKYLSTNEENCRHLINWLNNLFNQ